MHHAPCALVVDDAQAARHRLAVLLQLAGWQVYEAVGQQAAARAAARLDPDLVVTDLRMRGGCGVDLIQRLRRSGSRARFLLLAARPTERVRAQAAAAGVELLAKPVDPRALVRFLRARPAVPPAQTVLHPVGDPADADPLDRLREMYVRALPHRLATIAGCARDGDAAAVAASAEHLAAASNEVGHLEVSWMCRAIAAEAHRGVLSHHRLMQLMHFASIGNSGC